MRRWLQERRPRREGPKMPAGRKLPPMEPLRHLPELDEHMGQWVAVRGGRVIAVASSSKDLAYELHRRGIRDAVSQYVPKPSDGIRVGLG